MAEPNLNVVHNVDVQTLPIASVATYFRWRCSCGRGGRWRLGEISGLRSAQAGARIHASTTRPA